MNGIVFFRTKQLAILRQFYLDELGCSVWMDQGDCLILSHGSFLFGFCQREDADTEGIITFFYTDKNQVDEFYRKFQQSADEAPRDNPRYPIYHFFCRDPEGRKLEFQYFYNL